VYSSFVKLIRLTAREFLSFADVEVPFNDTLTVITGPNGAGKTSIARAIDVVTQTMRAYDTNDWADVQVGYEDAGRHAAQQWRVTVDVDFDDDELDFIRSWVEGCVLYLVGENNDRETIRMQQFALSHPDLGVAQLFARGSIEVDYDRRRRQAWRASWISATHTQDEPRVRLRLDTNLAGAEGLGDARPSYASAIKDTMLKGADTARGVLEPLPTGLIPLSLAEFARSGAVEMTARKTGRDVEPESIQRVFNTLGLDMLTTQRFVGFASIASHLIDRALLVSDNVRLPSARLWSIPDLDSRPDLATGQGLALALFRDKTGDPVARARFTRTQETFAQLAGTSSTLDLEASPVRARPGAPYGQGGRREADGQDGQIVLTPILSDGAFDVPLHLSGAGNGEAALLAAVLAYDPPVLVLDEPATNLSSAAQRRVLTALRRRSTGGRQTLLVTHSSTLVPTRLDAILRLGPAPTGTTVRRLGDDWTVQAHAELLRHTPVRDALFAAGVLLTEGISDEVMLRIWLAETEPSLEGSGVLLLNVGSDSAFAGHMKVLDAIGVPWAALVDGPAMETRLHLYDQDAPTDDFDRAKSYWEQRGVYTLAREFGTGERQKEGELETFFQRTDPQLWSRLSGSKPKKAEAFARTAEVPREVCDIWANTLKHLGLDA
jgi:energy-coupling factor transporter ATP-binding protein EcfA2